MDLEDDENIATKLDNKSMNILDLIQYWSIKYGIPKYEVEYARKEYEKQQKNNI